MFDDEVLADTLAECETLWLAEDEVFADTLSENETLTDDEVLEDSLGEWATFWLTVDETLGFEDGETLARSLVDEGTLFFAKGEIGKLYLLFIFSLYPYAKMSSFSARCQKSLSVSLKSQRCTDR